ncbi:Membrane lipoprotein TpN32 [Streptomyces sp. RB5]|uniref:Lipoprotein n=1 Tax=Streptomyces smaragdinus TaxID=2585196 RepID=A0A7K0CMS3_9ACTN|nr:MetQ/NlpA family ABC transporter substrate-binding protein [Streptomyces smaragdinus]MQY14074.1 Membrane lipoprotein TpN32 [Streptomyces smaragdinus]
MRHTLKITATLVSAAALTLGLAACGSDSEPAAAGAKADATEPLTVAATPVPHAEILTFVKDHLAADAGLKLEVKEFTDYVLPNTATQDGQVDANFFQHQPYLDDFNKKQGTDIVPVATVHLEPLGVYAKGVDDLSKIRSGATVAIPNDTTNGGRALLLLAENGLIELKDGAGTDATQADITDAKGLKFKELEAATLPRALDEVDAAVINGNYALEAGLTPAEDALATEKADGNPYANILAVKAGNEDDPRVQKLVKLLNSDEVKKFIEDEYQGSVIPAFGAAE